MDQERDPMLQMVVNTHATAASALNGAISILIYLAKRKLITPAELAAAYDSMSKPFALSEASQNPLVQDSQRRLDELFAEIGRYMKEGPLPPDHEPPRRDS